MTIKRNYITNHFKEDRLDRALYIAQTIGFGEVVKECYRADTKTFQQITDTGVMIARSDIDRAIVTVYVATMNQVRAVYGEDRVPSWLVAKVKKNNSKGKK